MENKNAPALTDAPSSNSAAKERHRMDLFYTEAGIFVKTEYGQRFIDGHSVILEWLENHADNEFLDRARAIWENRLWDSKEVVDGPLPGLLEDVTNVIEVCAVA